MNPAYRRLTLINVFLLLVAMIDALRVLSHGRPWHIDVGLHVYLDPIFVVGAIAFTMTSLGLSFLRMLPPK